MTISATDKYAETLAYYDNDAQKYCDQTRSVDLASIRARLTSRLVPGAHVLDAGCGSGRDSKAFLDEGFVVTAFDASAALAELAGDYIGQPVQVLRFQELSWSSSFDAVYASASLLHLDDADLRDALCRLVASMRPGAVLVAIFKHGDGIRTDAATGRIFNDMTAERAKQFLTECGAVYETDYLDVDKLGRGNDWLTVVGRRAC